MANFFILKIVQMNSRISSIHLIKNENLIVP